MDREQVAAELVRALRGRHPQPRISRRLGYSSNVVYAWEAARRSPGAVDFFRLAQLVGRDVEAAVTGLLPAAAGCLPEAGEVRAEHVQRLVTCLAEGARVSELSRTLGVNRNTLSRWLEGSTEPRLADLLALVEATTGRELDFLRLWAPPEALPSAQSALRELAAQRRLAHELPFSHAVLRALELSDYVHAKPPRGPAWLAGRVGIGVDEVERCLEALLEAKVVRRRAGRYVALRVLTVDTRDDPESNWGLKRHWATVGAERASPQAGLFSYNLFAVSDGTLQQLRRMHLGYYEEARRVIAEDTDPSRVVLLNLQLFDLARELPGVRPKTRAKAEKPLP